MLEVALHLPLRCRLVNQRREHRVELQGVTALVTGAGKRLGRAIAFTLAEGGADLILHVHSSTTAELVEAIEKMGRRVLVIKADLSAPGEAERLVRNALRHTGTVDVLVNSAAVFYPTPLSSLNVDVWRKVMQINMTTPLILAMMLGTRDEEARQGENYSTWGLEWTTAGTKLLILLCCKGWFTYVYCCVGESVGPAGAGE